MGKASDWLREERRRTLGDWVAFCLACGHTLRYFEERAADLDATCPACGGDLRSRCEGCGERIRSAFAVDCERCGAALRPAEAFGVPIRRPRA